MNTRTAVPFAERKGETMNEAVSGLLVITQPHDAVYRFAIDPNAGMTISAATHDGTPGDTPIPPAALQAAIARAIVAPPSSSKETRS